MYLFRHVVMVASILFSAAVIAGTETKSSAASSASSSKHLEPVITNEAEYAEFVRKSEGGHTRSAKSASSASSSSKSANTSTR